MLRQALPVSKDIILGKRQHLFKRLVDKRWDSW